MAAHQLHPADYGSVFAVVTLITFIGLPAGAFTLLMARETSIGRATGQHAASGSLLRNGNQALLLVGVVLASAIAATAPLVTRFFGIAPELLVAAALGIPFAVALPLLIGQLQGQQRFVAYSLIIVGQAVLKLAAAIVLGLVLGPFGIVAGISVASIAVYLLTFRLLRRKQSIRPNTNWWRPAASYLPVVLPSTIALGVLLSTDVLLVKHYFSTQVAGEYAAVAALGRAVFWAASGVAIVMFPKITFSGAQGRGGLHVVSASALLVLFGGLAGIALFWLAAPTILAQFAGGAYAAAAGYLPWYTVGMMFLGGIAVLIATQQSRGRPGFLAVLLPLTLLEPILVVAFHRTVLQVIAAVDVSMLVTLIGLAAIYVRQELSARGVPPSVKQTISGSLVAQVQANR